MNKTSILFIPLIICLALVSCNQDDKATNNAATTVTTVTAKPAATLPVAEGTLKTCQTLGQYFAISTNLHELSFSEEERAAIVEGFRLGLEGNGDQSFMQDNVQSISAFLQQRHMEKSSVDSKANKAAAAAFIQELKSKGEVIFTDSGLGYVILEAGSETHATAADAVSVNYRGTLIDGTVFDEAMDPEQPVTFPLGGVIPGFSEGLQLIGKGGKIRLYIPSELGYGDNPRPGGAIKAGSMLVFEVTIQDVQSTKAPTAEDLPPPPPPPAE